MSLDNDVILVSGLPRSGTSLMMRILERAGVPLLVDGVRAPDSDNPHGYYELERVKELERDNTWLHEGRGHAVKVIYRFLPYLPTDQTYRVVFMQRDLDEVLRSQEVMVRRRMGSAAVVVDDGVLRAAFQRELSNLWSFLARRDNIALLKVDHRELLTDTRAVLEQVVEFLQLDASATSLVHCVDDRLYRNRSRATPVLGAPRGELREERE